MQFLEQTIAPMGMGCWAIGGPFYAGDQALGYGNTNDADSLATIEAAYDAGIRLFDTAAVYGCGHAERLLGQSLKDKEDALIVSKIGLNFDEKSKQLFGNDTNPSNILPAIDSCLQRLQRDRIDLVLLHINTLDLGTAKPLFQQMELARQSGKVRAYGWSTDFPDHAHAMASMPGFEAVQHAMNIFHDVPAMNQCIKSRQLTSLIRSPLAMGVLTGKFDKTSLLGANDIRGADDNWSPPYFSSGKVGDGYLKRLQAVRELLQLDGRTLPQGALSWIMAKSDRAIALPGARTVAQIQENAKALEFGPLPKNAMLEIETLIQREPETAPREL